ncbi:hypothetical protein EWB00_004361 [Schistosoma japonicum]|uniref:U1-type domain-containing protein n=1 Tax=Schistosoma japonicum TaxID=6182 RepID=A0A4Z2D5Z6_SCHJA|nr:hypothetical protein EWB00_004361 [Schistosoma japonicum]
MSEVLECFSCKTTFCDHNAYWKHIYEDDCCSHYKDATTDSHNDKCGIQTLDESLHEMPKCSDKLSSDQRPRAKLKLLQSDKLCVSKISSMVKRCNRSYCDVCQIYMSPSDLARHETGKKHLKMVAKYDRVPKSVNSFLNNEYQGSDHSTISYQTSPLSIETNSIPSHNPSNVTENVTSSCKTSLGISTKCESSSQYIPGLHLPLNFVGTSGDVTSNKTTTKPILRRLCITEISSLLTQMVGDMNQKADFLTQMRIKCRDDLNSILCHEAPILQNAINHKLSTKTDSLIPQNESMSLSQLLLFWINQLNALDD